MLISQEMSEKRKRSREPFKEPLQEEQTRDAT